MNLKTEGLAVLPWVSQTENVCKEGPPKIAIEGLQNKDIHSNCALPPKVKPKKF